MPRSSAARKLRGHGNLPRLPGPHVSVPFSTRLQQGVFDTLYRNNLVYNACWEDPAVDRKALDLGPDDTVLVITSAGCNALDYALAGAGRVHAVDANPRQTALLELKLAAIRELGHADFFGLFGRGRHARFREIYRDSLRAGLSPFATAFWDRHGPWFESREGLYGHGLSGYVARGFRAWLAFRPALRDALDELFAAPDLVTQRIIFERSVEPALWGRSLRWALSRQVTMSMLGVPVAQHDEVRRQHVAGVPGFVRDSIGYVFRHLPAHNNYFWSLYLRGSYGAGCCPAYLEPRGFAALKAGAAARVVPCTGLVTDFLEAGGEPITRFVLLDHMDWLAASRMDELAREWAAIIERAAPGARVIFRSAHARPAFMDRLRVPGGGRGRPLASLLHFDEARAARLQREDRVHTYAGFHIAEFA